jgi:predicted nucleic acid-binding protein
MIDLFHPPKIEHKNAVKVKGYASVGGQDEIEDLEGWLKKQEKEQAKKTLAEKIKASRISDLRKAMVEAEKAYEKAFKKYQDRG